MGVLSAKMQVYLVFVPALIKFLEKPLAKPPSGALKLALQSVELSAVAGLDFIKLLTSVMPDWAAAVAAAASWELTEDWVPRLIILVKPMLISESTTTKTKTTTIEASPVESALLAYLRRAFHRVRPLCF